MDTVIWTSDIFFFLFSFFICVFPLGIMLRANCSSVPEPNDDNDDCTERNLVWELWAVINFVSIGFFLRSQVLRMHSFINNIGIFMV